MISIRFHIRRRRDGIDCRIKAGDESLRHFEIEAQPSGDDGLKLSVSASVEGGSAVGEREVEQAPEKPKMGNVIDDANLGIAGVNQWQSGGNVIGRHGNLLGTLGRGNLPLQAAAGKPDEAA
jgi:hypothetical protein